MRRETQHVAMLLALLLLGFALERLGDCGPTPTNYDEAGGPRSRR